MQSKKFPCDYCIREDDCRLRLENCQYVRRYYESPGEFMEYAKENFAEECNDDD